MAIFAFVDAGLIKPLPYPIPPGWWAFTESVKPCPLLLSFLSRLPGLEKAQHRFSILRICRGDTRGRSARRYGPQPVRVARVTSDSCIAGNRSGAGRVFYAGEDLPAAPKHRYCDLHRDGKAARGKARGGRGEIIRLANGVPYDYYRGAPRRFQFAPRGPAGLLW